jgi:hypothetical protein
MKLFAPSARIFPILLLLLSGAATLLAQPRLVTRSPASFTVGERVDTGLFVLDREMNRVRLREIIDPQSKVVVLVFFGGSADEARNRERGFRGPLWCEDSFDDLAVQRALVRAFRGEPVQIIAVASPPVYNPEPYGYADFLGVPEKSSDYVANTRLFIDRTEEQRRGGLLPFDRIYYDPKLRLLRRPSDSGGEDEFPWEGKFKWHRDLRTYGVPTLWLLDGEGVVLHEPFFGNDYDSTPPNVNYGYKDLRQAIQQFLDGS